MLCSTQALKGKRATCFSAIKDDVSNAGARYVDMEVVRDGNIITSRKPDDLPAFMQTILQAVKELKPAAKAGGANLPKWRAEHREVPDIRTIRHLTVLGSPLQLFAGTEFVR